MRLRPFGLAIVFAACAAAPPAAAPIPELEGRVAGTPLTCVRINSSSESLRPARDDGHVLLYGSGKTIWVNRLGSCGFHRDNDVLVLDQNGSSLCRGDIVRSFDRLSKIPGPSCVLDDFVPYTRDKAPVR